MKYAPQIAQLLLSILALFAISYFVDFGQVLSVLQGANLQYVLGGGACYMGINLLMSLRMKVLLEDMGARVGYWKITLAHFAGMLASDFTPARSGYFTTAAVLASSGVPASKAVASILSPQLFDFFLKVIVGSIAIAYMLSFFALGGDFALGTIAGILGVLLMLIFAVFLVFSRKFLLFLQPFFSIHFLGEKAWEMLAGMQEHSKAIKRKLPFVLGLLFCTWMLKGAEWMLLGSALSLSPNFPYGAFVFYLLLQPLITILQFLPFPTLAGAGLSEAGAIGALFFFGIDAPSAAAFALLTRGIMISIDLIGLARITKIDFGKILAKAPI